MLYDSLKSKCLYIAPMPENDQSKPQREEKSFQLVQCIVAKLEPSSASRV